MFDWVIPSEWEIHGAYIQNENKERLIDFRNSNVHVMSYSQPVHEKMTLDKLKLHLHYREDFPDVIPYRTSHSAHISRLNNNDRANYTLERRIGERLLNQELIIHALQCMTIILVIQLKLLY